MAKTKLIISALIVLTAVGYHQYKNRKVLSPIIEIETGKVQGIVTLSRQGRKINEYLGIPYGTPPIGKLRFEPSLPAERWEGIRRATSFGPKVNIITQQFYGDEDCLFLNVFTPQMEHPMKPMPVLVWIPEGGPLHYGSADEFKAKYFADEAVILVTIQYRLGALGFMNTGDEVVRGNMGLKDQVLALKWVQENIKHFGGDRKKVTLVSGSSAHLHMLSKMSSGLFYKAISQSGTAISPYALSHSPKEAAIRYGKKLGCVTDSTKDMVECMRQTDARTFVKIHKETTDLLHDSLSMFTATVETIKDENAFLTENPSVLLNQGRIENRVPWITGVNAEEGLIVSTAFMHNKTLLESLNNDWYEVVPKILFHPLSERTSQNIRNQYFGKTWKISQKHKSKLTSMVSDSVFFYPASESARLQSKVSPVYLYYYPYAGDFSLAHLVCIFRGDYHYKIELLLDTFRKWINVYINGQRHHHFGACHGDEQFLQFDTTIASDITAKDGVHYKMSTDFVKLWADFAKDTPDLNFRGVKWIPVNPDAAHLRYLLIDMSYGIVDEPFEKRISFWRENRLLI